MRVLDLMGATYKRQTAISAHIDLWLVDIYEDPGMSQWATTTIAADELLVRPSDGLLVNKTNGSLRPWLMLHHRLLEPRSRHRSLPRLLAPTPDCSPVRRLYHPRGLWIHHLAQWRILDPA